MQRTRKDKAFTKAIDAGKEGKLGGWVKEAGEVNEQQL